MKNRLFLFVLFLHAAILGYAATAPKQLLAAPGTISATSATMVWENTAGSTLYHVMLNGKEVGTTNKTNYIIAGLNQLQTYSCAIKAEDAAGKLSAAGKAVKFTTTPQGKVITVTDFGAKGDGITLNTKAIQKAIDACDEYGTVIIPEGTFVSGALFLKSRMTLQINKGGTLKGSANTEDYEPFINNRFEGWEMKTYASLINAGTMDSKGNYTTSQISIKGEGTISGGGGALGKAMIAKHGMRSRGRLIMLLNCKDVELQGLQIKDSPCWTIHYIYSKGITCHDMNIVSNAHNGDGLDPDSSDDSYIFNCSFSTGDDCIAIKSGKNPEGYTIGRPTRNVQITYCDFTRGHGISIGSEMSGGVSDVLVRDCTAGALLHGMQIKGTKERGGYVKNVTVTDCQLLKITIFSALNYNNDGAAAPEPPMFENFKFANIDLTKATLKDPVININGFKDAMHKLKNVRFNNIMLPDGAKVVVNDAQNVRFVNVKTLNGNKPEYTLNNSTETTYQ
ncbi:glycoside hydrolase family 28 protein [Mucilaginibacter aquatilis]|uniref:Glycoside hydrolase family 28 protein n=1 Tax=Mucilaginibacter aquatilis TaxID=1517760 RepID=A0A6I4IEG9_9SPHI|nr:glycoside hydrolase family 28 protein [Mucilaginibacter aquatilis]MVN92188.1 glycoside hydrolase family 28 protein [Mucilaginibacter aquatilis]